MDDTASWFRYGAKKEHGEPLWGIWDHHQQCWAERPTYKRWVAESTAQSMCKAYAAGFADATIERVR